MLLCVAFDKNLFSFVHVSFNLFNPEPLLAERKYVLGLAIELLRGCKAIRVPLVAEEDFAAPDHPLPVQIDIMHAVVAGQHIRERGISRHQVNLYNRTADVNHESRAKDSSFTLGLVIAILLHSGYQGLFLLLPGNFFLHILEVFVHLFE